MTPEDAKTLKPDERVFYAGEYGGKKGTVRWNNDGQVGIKWDAGKGYVDGGFTAAPYSSWSKLTRLFTEGEDGKLR